MDFAEAVYGRWADLRARGCLEDVLPSARAWKSVGQDGQIFGYDTFHHQFRRRVTIPGSGPNGGSGIAGLVESYYSVRHSNGWGHNLHVHVVEVKSETLQVSHLAHLFRCVAGLKLGLKTAGISPRMQAKEWLHRRLYVHGALLGPSASGDVLMAEAMLDALYDHHDNGGAQPPIRVGVVSVNPKKEILIKRIEPPRNFFADPLDRAGASDNAAQEAQLTAVLDDLLGAAPMWSEWVAARRGEEQEIRKRWQQEREATEAQARAESIEQAPEPDAGDGGGGSRPPGGSRLLN